MSLDLIELPDDVSSDTFPPIDYQGSQWDLTHLTPFAFRASILLSPGNEVEVDVVVLYSCHCFTHGLESDPRPVHQIPASELYSDGRETRVLNPERHALSVGVLRDLVHQLPTRRIVVAHPSQGNYLTVEVQSGPAAGQLYGVFFEVTNDRNRKKRLILRIQSAYLLDKGLSPRQKAAKKVGWATLLKSAYTGVKIRA